MLVRRAADRPDARGDGDLKGLTFSENVTIGLPISIEIAGVAMRAFPIA